jgi:hypothetical protein
LFAVKSDRRDFALKPESGKVALPPQSTSAHRPKGRKQKRQHPPEIQQIIGLKKESL